VSYPDLTAILQQFEIGARVRATYNIYNFSLSREIVVPLGSLGTVTAFPIDGLKALVTIRWDDHQDAIPISVDCLEPAP
jgi:hypothetical protein